MSFLKSLFGIKTQRPAVIEAFPVEEKVVSNASEIKLSLSEDNPFIRLGITNYEAESIKVEYTSCKIGDLLKARQKIQINISDPRSKATKRLFIEVPFELGV